MFFRSTIGEGVAQFEVGPGRDGGRHGPLLEWLTLSTPITG